MKIKRTSRGNPTGIAAQSRPHGSVADKSKPAERKDVSDTVTLSTDALSAGAADSVEAVEAVDSVNMDGTDGHGPLPDPRETGKAILEKELAGVFKEIYL